MKTRSRHFPQLDRGQTRAAAEALRVEIIVRGLGDGTDLEQRQGRHRWTYQGWYPSGHGVVHRWHHPHHPAEGDAVRIEVLTDF